MQSCRYTDKVYEQLLINTRLLILSVVFIIIFRGLFWHIFIFNKLEPHKNIQLA